MYIWEGKSFAEVADLPRRRDPTRYATGALLSGGDPSQRRFLWFQNHSELSAFLWRLEPQRWGLHGAQLIAYKDATTPIFSHVDMLGLNEELREVLNAHAQPHFRVDWWGHLRELMASEGGLAAELRRAFQGSDRPVAVDDVAAFADFLHQRFPVESA